MDLSAPYRIIESGTDLEVLRVLAGTTGSMTGRTVSRMVRTGSHPTVLRSLTRLDELGILDVEVAGRAYLYTLNREHLAAPALLEIVALRRRMLDLLRDELATLSPVLRAAGLFGSGARGDGDIRSDLDLLLVVEDVAIEDEWDLSGALGARIHARTGNPPSFHVLAPADLLRLEADDAPIYRSLHSDYLALCGPGFAELMRTLPDV